MALGRGGVAIYVRRGIALARSGLSVFAPPIALAIDVDGDRFTILVDHREVLVVR